MIGIKAIIAYINKTPPFESLFESLLLFICEFPLTMLIILQSFLFVNTFLDILHIFLTVCPIFLLIMYQDVYKRQPITCIARISIGARPRRVAAAYCSVENNVQDTVAVSYTHLEVLVNTFLYFKIHESIV